MPRVRVRLRDLENLGKLQCTLTEAADFLNCTTHTLSRLFKRDPRALAAWERGRGKGKVGLRRKQMRLANTNAAMAIHLGKQYLDQKDKVQNELTGKDGGPIETTDVSKLSVDERKQLRLLLTRTMQPEETSR